VRRASTSGRLLVAYNDDPGEYGNNEGSYRVEASIINGISRLSVEKQGAGSGTITDASGALDCGGTCAADFEQGETVTLEATPDADSTFAGWSGACSGTDATCVLTLTEDTVVTASFAEKAPPGTPSGSATGAVFVGGVAYSSGPIPYGSRVDVTSGTLTLTTRAGTLRVWGGGVSAVFVLLKRAERGRPLDLLKLAGGDFSVCAKRALSSADGNKKKKKVRRLWAKGKGKFRTQGKYSYTTVRGTEWLTADRCDGTLTQVKQGRVEVVDLVHRVRVQLRAGQRYLAAR
jgi:hypothetical protein